MEKVTKFFKEHKAVGYVVAAVVVLVVLNQFFGVAA